MYLISLNLPTDNKGEKGENIHLFYLKISTYYSHLSKLG